MMSVSAAAPPDEPSPAANASLSVAAAAAALGCSPRTVRRAIARGELVAVKDGRGARIPAGALAEYRRRQAAPPTLRLLTALPAWLPPRGQTPLPDSAWELPTPLTPFFGREAEIETVSAELVKPAVRLLTLVGMGGVGKTRLALQVASQVADAFPEGVIFVPLETVPAPELAGAAILRALGRAEQGDEIPRVQLQRALMGRRCLLVLDNVEHLVAAAPGLAALLTACDTLTILATSRTTLRLSGERVVRVGPLPVPAAAPRPGDAAGPDGEPAAVQLFLDRAHAADPTFQPTPPVLRTVGEICRRLDGLPLAIELAAARCAVLPPAALLTRLDHRLAVLGDGPRDQPPRLQTMRNAIAWSDALLPPPARALFHRLAVFPGAFDLAAAAAMLDGPPSEATDLAALPLVETLLSHSLIAPATTPSGGPQDEPRFAMLETLRDYGREQLLAMDGLDHARARHADYFQAALGAAPEAPSAKGAWFDWLEAERPNLYAALAWRISHDQPVMAQRLTAVMSPFWPARGHLREGRDWLLRCLALPGDDTPDRVLSQCTLALLQVMLGESAAAAETAATAAAAAAALGLPSLQSRALLILGAHFEHHGDLAAAGAAYEQSLHLARTAGDGIATGHAIDHRCALAWAAGDHPAFITLATEALALWRTLDDPPGLLAALDQMSLAARVSGDLATQAALAAEIMGLAQTFSDPYAISSTLWTAAAISAERGQSRFAVRMFGAEETVRAGSGFVLDQTYIAEYTTQVSALRETLGEPRFTTLWLAGAQLDREQALLEAQAAMRLLASAGAPEAGDLTSLVAVGLTAREYEVLRLLVNGYSDKDIGIKLFVARSTASKHVSAILEKLGATSRTGATAIAYRDGLV